MKTKILLFFTFWLVVFMSLTNKIDTIMKKITFLLFLAFLSGIVAPILAKDDNSKFTTPYKTTEILNTKGLCGDWKINTSRSKVEAHSAKAVWTYEGDTSNQSTYWMYIKEEGHAFEEKYTYNSYGESPEFTFTGLKASTSYTVKIERKCNLAKTSKEISFRTLREPSVDNTPDCLNNWSGRISQISATTSSVKFEWPSAGKKGTFKVEYRKNAHDSWIVVNENIAVTQATISGLPTSTLETEYEVKITKRCLGNSLVSITGTVKTGKAQILDCVGIWSLDIKHMSTSSSIKLNWNKIGGATYEVWYREYNAFDAHCYTRATASASGTSYTVKSLKKDTRYDFVVIKKCPNFTVTGNFCPASTIDTEPFDLTNPNVSKRSFTTKSSDPTNFICQAVSGVGHKNVTINSATLSFANQHFLSNNLEEITYVWEGAGETTRVRHDAPSLNIRGLCPNTTYTYWIEKMCRNQTEPAIDGKYTFTTENYSTCPTPKDLYFDAANSHYKNRIAWGGSCGVASYTVEVKKTGTNNWTSFTTSSTELIEPGEWATSYTARVKANCGSIGGSGWSNEISFTTSESCPQVTNLRVTNIVHTGIEMEWDEPLSMTTRYIVQVNEADNGWSGDMYSSSDRRLYFAYLTNKRNTRFQFRVRPDCSNSKWVYTTAVQSWSDPNATCDIPTGFRKIYIHPAAGKIAWNAVPGATSYRLGILESGTWSGIDVGNVTEYISNNLTPGKAYAVVVRSECGNGKHSDWSGVIRFTTPRLSLKAKIPSLSYGANESSIIYPNTNQGEFTIKFKDSGKQLRAVTIFNMAGMKVFHEDYDREQGEQSYNLTNKLSSGMYKVQISSENGIEYKTIIIE